MKIIKPSVEFLGAVPTDYAGAVKFKEQCGRTCYKSEDKITPDSAEKFVRKLIKAGHLAMVEHSNFVVRMPIMCLSPHYSSPVGKFHNHYIGDEFLYIGGNLTAWLQSALSEGPAEVFEPFCKIYAELFGHGLTEIGKSNWEVCPHDEIPKELHRYSARFICDRGVSHELVRHRLCSFAQESTRYVNYGGKDMEFIEPVGYEYWNYAELSMFESICRRSEQAYNVMLHYGLKPQQARAVLPNSLKTEVVVTADLAEWQHIFKLRCAPGAHPDFVRLSIPLRDKFIESGLI